MKTHYFVDFDNTISRCDVWDKLVRTFAPDGWQEVVQAYIRGEISSREGNLRVAGFFPECREQAEKLVREIGVDPTFAQFTHWAEQKALPVTIVSDGYNFYIDILLREAGLENLNYCSNHLEWTSSGIKVNFPYQQDQCERDMAHCKCQHLNDKHHIRRVYIGDGISDYCAARKCEQIYAKRELKIYCEDNAIDFIPFDNFLQIMEQEQAFLEQTIQKSV